MIALDQTGFPIVRFPALGLEVGLLPVVRAQFEFYLGDCTHFDRRILQELNTVSPRGCWRQIPRDQPEGVFLSGVLPDEVNAFALWLGGFRLPTDAEWRAIDNAIATQPHVQLLRTMPRDSRIHPAARAILEWRLNCFPVDWRSACMFENGLFEWVRKGTGFGLQGRPRPKLFRVIHNPEVYEAITPRTSTRSPGYGVRLVRPLNLKRQVADA